MIKIIDRYILKAFFVNYAIALTVMIGLYVTLDLFVNLDEFTEVQSDTLFQTLGKIVDFYGYNLPLYFAQLAGVITLVAACFTLGRFHRGNELTAILASGTSFYRVLAPLLVAALGLNVLWFVDQEFVIPRVADKLARKHADIEGRHSIAVWFQPDRDHALVSAAMFHPRAKEIRGLLVMKRRADGRMRQVVRADRARWDEERLAWHLENGSYMDFEHDPVPAEGGELGHVPLQQYASDLTPKELALQQASQWMSFLSLADLNRLQIRFPGAGAGAFIKAKHQRLTTVLVNMILLCMGVPFFLNRERPSVVVAGGRCLAVCLLALMATFICHSLDLSPYGLSAALPPWIPVLAFAPLSVVMLDAIKT